MIIPKEMLMRTDEMEVISSETIEQPILIVPNWLYKQIKEELKEERKKPKRDYTSQKLYGDGE